MKCTLLSLGVVLFIWMTVAGRGCQSAPPESDDWISRLAYPDDFGSFMNDLDGCSQEDIDEAGRSRLWEVFRHESIVVFYEGSDVSASGPGPSWYAFAVLLKMGEIDLEKPECPESEDEMCTLRMCIMFTNNTMARGYLELAGLLPKRLTVPNMSSDVIVREMFANDRRIQETALLYAPFDASFSREQVERLKALAACSDSRVAELAKGALAKWKANELEKGS